jgi:large subunit ribosomal protein L9
MMKVILKETIPTLGIIGSEVKVANGYARNYLLPQGKAVEATPENRKVLEQAKVKFELQIAKEKEFASEMAKRVEGVVCTISSKVTDEDRLYGSITSHDILDSLKTQNVEVERRMILLPSPIKTLGTYKIPIRLYKDVEPEIVVEVISEEKE